MLRQSRPNLYCTDALIAEASNNSSTATGDSGGPAFHINGSRVYLMGATLGANFLPDRLTPDKPIINNAATALYAGGICSDHCFRCITVNAELCRLDPTIALQRLTRPPHF
ncbi:hypothetical protein [Chromobacterium vaccinii]|uniref:hypothetical protein n=1 Tax=Chromobacterium vaccinii TaxID=1108595 RepID=UPI000A5A5664|nr:hypothetical protein [Chromobacterium vaccinii]